MKPGVAKYALLTPAADFENMEQVFILTDYKHSNRPEGGAQESLMNKRLLSKLEQGEGTTLMGKLFLTRRQRQVILKWFLFSLVYLVLQVMQDVLLAEYKFGGLPGPGARYLLLVCLMQGPWVRGLFALLAGGVPELIRGSAGAGVSAGDHLRRCLCCPHSGAGTCSGGFGL